MEKVADIVWAIYEDLIFNSCSDSETDILVSVLRPIPIPPKHRVTYLPYSIHLEKKIDVKSQKYSILGA